MSTKDDGGSAFPLSHLELGMTLRDYFAAKALQGWLASFGPDDCSPKPAQTAAFAYEFADAMMEARKS